MFTIEFRVIHTETGNILHEQSTDIETATNYLTMLSDLSDRTNKESEENGIQFLGKNAMNR
jgi:hypothetical protein